MGYAAVGPVPTVSEAVVLLNAQEIDGAVLDISLGSGQKSFPLARLLKERNIPFLFVSGYQEGDLPVEFSGVPLCTKPYSGEALRAGLERLFGHRSVPAELPPVA